MAKRLTKLPGDFIHVDSGVCIETDESQHFTSHRARTLDLYPRSALLGFNIDDHKALCREWAPIADRFRANKAAVGFGPSGRQRQRAYNDALRDLATPLMGLPPLIRVAAPERDGALAYERVRDQFAHGDLKLNLVTLEHLGEEPATRKQLTRRARGEKSEGGRKRTVPPHAARSEGAS